MKREFATDVLDETLARKSEKRERERKQLVERIRSALDGLSRIAAFDEAYIFGSVSKPGAFKERSDVDIAFAGMKSEDVVRATAYLSRELGFDVDVIQLEGYRLASKIMREGIPWKRAK